MHGKCYVQVICMCIYICVFVREGNKLYDVMVFMVGVKIISKVVFID